MVSVLIAHEQPIVALGLKAEIERNSNYTVSGYASTLSDVSDQIRQLNPDVLAIGAKMLAPNSDELLNKIKGSSADTHVLVFSECSCEAFTEAVSTKKADSYVLLDTENNQMDEAIYKATSCKRDTDPSQRSVAVLSHLNYHHSAKDNHRALTHREKQVLTLTAEGFTNSEIAARLFISRRTVEDHRIRLMRKLKLHKSGDLVRYAIHHGFIKP